MFQLVSLCALYATVMYMCTEVITVDDAVIGPTIKVILPYLYVLSVTIYLSIIVLQQLIQLPK